MQKAIACFVICLIAITHIKAQQVYTVRDGNWEADSVWYNGIKPTGNGDTTHIFHHISLNTDFTFQNKAMLHIDTGGWLCGNQALQFNSHAFLYHEGFLGLYLLSFFNSSGYSVGYIIIKGGYLKVAGDEGEEGGVDLWGGCVHVLEGVQTCYCEPDTSISITVTDQTATFQTVEKEVSYYFGDGGYSSSYGQVAHTYRDSGLYRVRITITTCCGNYYTMYRHVYIPPKPPVCQEIFPFKLGPVPTDHGFTISRQFCTNHQVKVKVYTMNGSLVDSYTFLSVDSFFSAYIPTENLANACYVVVAETSAGTLRQKIIVMHDY